MSENYIHIDNIVFDRNVKPGQMGIGASVHMNLDGANKFTVVAVLSQLLNDLEIEPLDISAYRNFVSENVVRVDRTKMEVEEIRKALARYRRLKAEMEGEE